VTGYPDYPTCLSEGDFAIIRFRLVLQGGGCLGLDHLLGIGPLLRHAAREVLGPRAAHLFNPPLSADPVALRRFQKPAPGFVLRPDPGGAGDLLEGDSVDFEVLLLGRAVQSLGDLLLVMQQLGECGLTGTALRFDVAQVRALGLDGQWRQVWSSSRSGPELAPEVMRLDAWLEQAWPDQAPVTLDFMTPLRLITQGRVLRRPRFSQLFPFLLRRVSAMLHAHCHLEPVETPTRVLAAAGEVEARWTDLRWSDWRETGERGRVGGVTGRLLLNGEGLDKVLWVVLLATLFGVGKGAAYGAGRCRAIGAV
jgi:hypothetical protein